MASPKKTSTAAPARQTAPRKSPSPATMATRVKPVRTIPSGPVTHSKTLANGQPRPKSRRGK